MGVGLLVEATGCDIGVGASRDLRGVGTGTSSSSLLMVIIAGFGEEVTLRMIGGGVVG